MTNYSRFFLTIGTFLLAVAASNMDPLVLSAYADDAPGKTALDSDKKRAADGDAEGEMALGTRYLTGDGVSKNYAEAEAWLRKAANQGNSTAQNTLGTLYMNIDGIAAGTYWPAEGMRWRVAAEHSRRSRIAMSLGLHSGQSQAHVKAILAAHGYQGLRGSGPWSCFPNGLVNGEDTISCGSRGNQVAKLIVLFGMAKVYRDPDTTEFHRVPTDRLLVAYFEFAEDAFGRSSILNFYSAGLKKCNGVNNDDNGCLNF